MSEDLCAALATRQLPNGGWPALSSSLQSSVEASALAHLALASDSGLVRDRATTFLLNVQNPNGSWPAFVGDDHLGSWTTSLVLIALRSVAEASGQRFHGREWLIRSAGKESNWFWKWKFRTTDRHVRLDPDGHEQLGCADSLGHPRTYSTRNQEFRSRQEPGRAWNSDAARPLLSRRRVECRQ